MSVLLGFCYVVWALGWRVFDPTDLGWLDHDPATAFLGFSALRAETGWHFPPTWVTGLGTPVGASAAYFDIVPILALPLSWLNQVLPRDFHIFWLVILVNAALQAWFGLRLAHDLSGGRTWSTLAGGLLLLMAPVFLFRLHGHYALSSQWLLLAALLLYLRAGVSARRRRLAGWALLLLWVAGGVNPYLLAMVALVLLAALARAALSASSPPLGNALLLLVCGGLVAMASLLFHGFVVLPFELGDVSGAGYDLYSVNLLTLVDPWGQSRFVDRFDLPPGLLQGEGSAYLGLAVLGLLFVVFPCLLCAARRLWRAWMPLGLVIMAASLFAFSNRVTFGSQVLFEYPLPDWFKLFAGIFHAGGRFIWLLHYSLLLAVIWGVLRWRRQGFATLLLCTALLCQLIEFAPLRDDLRSLYKAETGKALNDPLWQFIGVDSQHLVVLPAVGCGRSPQLVGRKDGYWLFGDLARRARMTINSAYMARYSAAYRDEQCFAQPASLLHNGPQPGTAYVLSDGMARSLALASLDSHWCRRANGVVLCRRADARTGLAVPLQKELFSRLALGSPVALAGGSPFVIQRDGPAGLAFRTPPAPGGLRLQLDCPQGVLPANAATALRLAIGFAAAPLVATLAPTPVTVPGPGDRLSLALGVLANDTVVGLAPTTAWPGLARCQLNLAEEGATD